MSKILTIDFETYYDNEYTLSKLTTQEYVNSPLFEIIGFAVSVNGGEPRWYDGSMDTKAMRQVLLDYGVGEEGCLVVAHNAMFDGAILEWRLGLKPWRYFCTMMGSRPIVAPYTGSMSLAAVSEYLQVGAKGKEVHKVMGMHRHNFDGAAIMRYAAYCCQDVALTYRIFTQMWGHFPKDELRLLDLTVKKFTRPKLRLDANVIDEALVEEIQEKQHALRQAGLSEPTELMSNPKFADLLRRYSVDPPMKLSPTTGQTTYAFAKSDPGFQKLEAHPNPKVRALVKARLLHKSTITETRLDRFRAVAGCTQDRVLAVPLLYYGAHPGRFSGLDKLNLQNLGRKSPLRRAISAPPGYQVVAGDLSQIEARITACLAGQNDLVEAFRYYDSIKGSDRDVYCQFGDSVYARTITKADEKERFVAKTGVLSLGYQSGYPKFFESMQAFGVEDFSIADAQSVVETYRALYTKIVQQWDTMEHIKRCMLAGQSYEYGPIQVLLGRIRLPNGMYLTYPELTNANGRYRYKFGKEWRDIYGGKLTENVVQALARIVMTTAELRLARAGLRAALSVHDELIFVVRTEQVEVIKKALHMALTAKVDWMPNLPVNCEIKSGDCYADAK